MDNNHKLALYVAYYLSRFNIQGYQNLGYRTMNDAHIRIGKTLNTNPHTVKNMRDQFDPLHDHRVGWYQEPLSPSRVSVAEALQDLSEPEIRAIVIDILNGNLDKDEFEKQQLLSVIDSENDKKLKREFILRNPTGKKAEEYFIDYFNKFRLPVSGSLIDRRDFGGGYDFKIETNNVEYFIEVKGQSQIAGGVLFTSKEWQVAKTKKDEYFLAIVSDISSRPVISFIQDPYGKLNAKKSLTKTIQISYSVPKSEIEKVLTKRY